MIGTATSSGKIGSSSGQTKQRSFWPADFEEELKLMEQNVRNPPDGRYTIDSYYFDYAPKEENFTMACMLNLIIKDSLGNSYVLHNTVDYLTTHMEENLEHIIFREIDVVGRHIVPAREAYLRRGGIELNNDIHGYYPSLVRDSLFRSLGMLHLAELDPHQTYKVETVSVEAAESPVDGKKFEALVVQLTLIDGELRTKAEEEQSIREVRTTRLMLYLNWREKQPPIKHRIYEFFAEKLGSTFTPNIIIPTILATDNVDALFAAVTNTQPKFKPGEVYVLDGVYPMSGNKLVIKAHNIREEAAYEEARLSGRPSERTRTEEAFGIKIVVNGCKPTGEEYETWAYLRTIPQIARYLSGKVAEPGPGSKRVFSVTTNIYDHSLDYMQVPMRQSMDFDNGPFFFGIVEASDAKDISAFKQAAAEMINDKTARVP